MAVILSAYEQEDRRAFAELCAGVKKRVGNAVMNRFPPPQFHSMYDHYRDKPLYAATVGRAHTTNCETVDELAAQVAALMILGE